jgi:hypothetical protein
MNAHPKPTRGKALRPINTLTFTQRLAAHALLTERIELLESGLCKYKDPNANDTTIAAELGPEYNNSNIKSIRAECFGRIWKQPAAPVQQLAPAQDFAPDIQRLFEAHDQMAEATNKANRDAATKIEALTTRYHHAMERIEVLEKRFTGLLEKVNRR